MPTPIPPDDTLPSADFLIEDHIADAMPDAHWHDHIEVNFLPRGQMDYLMNGRRVTLLPRRLALFWAAIHHQAIAVGQGQRLICAYIPIGEFLSLPLPSDFRAAVLRGELVQTATEHPGDAARLSDMVAQWAGSPAPLRQLYRDELILRLRRMALEPLAQHSEQAPIGPLHAGVRSVRHVEKMTAFINENLGHGLTADDVAAASGLHSTSARAAFRKVLGITIGRYVRRQRLSQAMRFLAETDREIAEIAHLAGYQSVQRLYDAFAEQLGKTPRRFRLEIKGGVRAG